MTRHVRKLIHWTPRILYALLLVIITLYATFLIALSPQMRFSESYVYFFPSMLFLFDGLIIAIKENVGAILLSTLSFLLFVFFQVYIGGAFILAATIIAFLFLFDYSKNFSLYRKHTFFRYL